MSIESTFDRIATSFERIATSLEALVELEKSAMEHCKTNSVVTLAEPAPVGQASVEAPAPEATPAEPEVAEVAEDGLNWNPLVEEPQLRYSSAKKEVLRRLCREKGVDADAMGFGPAHAFLRSGAEVAKPEESAPVAEAPVEQTPAKTAEVVEFTVPEVRSKLIAWVKENGKSANDGVAFIQKVTGKGKLVDLTPAELAQVMEALDGSF